MPPIQEPDKPVTDRIVSEITHLIERFPDSSDFLGKDIYYPKPKRGFFKPKKLPDLNSLRDQVQRISEREVVSGSRENINKKLKQFPHIPDLNALKAIQLFNDISQSGTSQGKTDALYDPLLTMTGALYNGGNSIFNANWFMKIYIRYLEVMREKLAREYSYAIHHADSEVRKMAERLYPKILKLPRLLQIKNHLAGLTQLNVKLKGTGIITENITSHELKMACQAFAANNPSKTLTTGKPANSVIFITLALNSLFSRIPILKQLVVANLKSMPDLNRDLILQKQMIVANGKVNDFLLALASGNKSLAKEIANDIYNKGVRNISFYLENALIKTQYEADPFMKVAWTVREARDLFDGETNKKRFFNTIELLSMLMDKRCQHQASLEKASAYLHDIRTLIAEKGWE